MAARRFVDTNVLLYSVSRHPGEAAKRQRALAILDSGDLALSTQVLQEFYVQATRAGRRDALSHEIASGLVHAWTRFPVQDVTLAIVTAALDVRARYGFSYWDSAIVAAAQAMECRELLSEDLSHGQKIGGVRIVNPFR